jgi:hypothetical protein
MDNCTFTVTAVEAKPSVRVRVLAATSDPLATIPLHERWIWQNTSSMQSFMRAKEDVRNGRIVDLGSFAQYADDSDDD